MNLRSALQKNTKFLLAVIILVNMLLFLASALLGDKAGYVAIYLFIYEVMIFIMPVLLILLCLFIYAFIKEGFSKTVNEMNVHLVLAFFAVLTIFGFITYAWYFID